MGIIIKLAHNAAISANGTIAKNPVLELWLMIWGSSSHVFIAAGTDMDFLRKNDMHEMIVKEIEWLENRGIDPEIAAKAGLLMRSATIGFQYRFGGQKTFAKWRTLDKTKWWIDPSGQETSLFNLDALRDHQPTPEVISTPLIVTEGEMDAISLIQSGFEYVVSVPTGANERAYKTEGSGFIDPENDHAFSYLYLGETPELLNKFEKIVLFTDNDSAGFSLRDELAMRLGKRRCFFVTPPDDCKDANDVLKKHGEAVLCDVIEKAKPILPDRIVGIYDLPPEPDTPAIKTGFDGLDFNLILTKPEFFVSLGRPGTGKSQWLRTLAWHLSFGDSQETFKTGSDVMRGLLVVFEDKVKRVKRDMEQYMVETIEAKFSTQEEKAKTRRIINDRIFMRQRSRDTLDVDWLISVMIEAKTRHNIDYVVLDPWNEIEHDFKRESETVYTGNAIRKIKRVCEDYGILFLIAIHPAKPDGKIDMYSAAGSAHWYNKCDHGVVFEKVPWSENVVEVWVQKAKDWETMGHPGKVYMRWNRKKRDYEVLTGDKVADYIARYENNEKVEIDDCD